MLGRTTFVATALLCIMSSCDTRERRGWPDQIVPVEGETGEAAIFALLIQSPLATVEDTELVFSLFPNGVIVFRSDDSGPLIRYHLAEEEMADVLEELKGITSGMSNRHVLYSGPDAVNHVLYLSLPDEKDTVILKSWHPLAELSGDVIATQDALVPVKDEAEAHAQRAQWTPEYREFRCIWTDLEGIIAEVTKEHPADASAQVDGDHPSSIRFVRKTLDARTGPSPS